MYAISGNQIGLNDSYFRMDTTSMAIKIPLIYRWDMRRTAFRYMFQYIFIHAW